MKQVLCEDCQQAFEKDNSYYDIDSRKQVIEYKCGCPKIQLEVIKEFKEDELAPWELIM